MKIRSLLLVCTVAFLTACNITPVNLTSTDQSLMEYRYFLNDLTSYMNAADGYNDAKVRGVLQIREEILREVGNARSFDEFDDEQYYNFVSLSKKLYHRMCADLRFMNDRSALYELLLTPSVDVGLAGI